ncbi:hypothetical protein M9Y10_002072 [Tritrichomonas musculus]|uniref:Uncharacterized protein n=1 Tax=Tritrichomonas musculus TaxID=1915356 RepID=A0ABR2LBN7_9EUKA
MFANGKNPINVAKGWKGNAISEKKKNVILKGIIEDLKNLPSKNRITEDMYEKISKEKLDASAEAPNPLAIQGPEKIRQITHDNWISNENVNPHVHEFTEETYNLAHLMKSYSEKLYELLYQSLFLPNPSKVETHFSKIISNTKQQLIDKNNVEKNFSIIELKTI